MTAIEHINLLGLKASDKVTGFSGVITSVSFDLYGCIQLVVSPPVGSDGKKPDGHWFDLNRLDIDHNGERVMNVPAFARGYVAEGRKGAAEKPAMEQL